MSEPSTPHNIPVPVLSRIDRRDGKSAKIVIGDGALVATIVWTGMAFAVKSTDKVRGIDGLQGESIADVWAQVEARSKIGELVLTVPVLVSGTVTVSDH